MSWMEWLCQRGFITLLRPSYQDGALALPEWDRETRTGARITLAGVEFCGLGYLGARTEPALAQLPGLLTDHPTTRVLILHAGVGNEGPDIGRIPSSAVEALKESVDYLALGHVHHRYERDGWAFNPGAPENWDLGECDQEKGFYVVTVESGRCSVTYEGSRRRPAVLLRVDVSGTDTAEQASERVLRETSDRSPGSKALCRLIVKGDTTYAPSDVDLSAIREAMTERDDWLYIEPDNQINQGALILEGGLLSGSRQQIEREVLARMVERDGTLGRLRERALDAVFELKELALNNGDAQRMAELALSLADATDASDEEE